MVSLRYRTLFTIVLLLFSTLLCYELMGQDRFKAFVREINNSFISPTYKTISEVTENLTKGEFLRSNQSFNPDGRIGIGAYLADLSDDRFFRVVDHENMINHKLQYLLLFRAWGDEDSDFPSSYVDNMKRLNLVPVITWEPWARDFKNATAIQSEYSLESITSGAHDSYIRKWAKDAKEADLLVILRFAHEATTHPGERSWYPWQGKPANYVVAFRRIVNIFREEGASNVRFMWNPVSFWPDSTMMYYPGDSYVDYLGLTVLNHGVTSGQDDERWKKCEELLVDQFSVVSSVDKPTILVEFASSERGGSKRVWLSDCFEKIKEIDNLVGIITLESERDVAYPNVTWSIDSSVSSLDTFKREISFSVFK